MNRLYIGLSCLVGFIGGYFVASPDPIQPKSATNTIYADHHAPSSKSSLAKSSVQIHSKFQLSNTLIEADQEIERLKNINAALAKQINNLNLSLDTSTTIEALFDRFDKLPDSFIEDKLALVLREKNLDRIGNSRLFSKRLLEAALDTSPIARDTASATIEFFTSPQYGIRPVSHSATVNGHDRIFAHVTPTGPIDMVLIKWQNLTSGEILMLRDHHLSTNNGSDYFSLRPGGGWKPGTYQVSVYHVDDALSPIGSNQYSISIVTDTPFDKKIADQAINETLILSGQAIPKNVQ